MEKILVLFLLVQEGLILKRLNYLMKFVLSYKKGNGLIRVTRTTNLCMLGVQQNLWAIIDWGTIFLDIL